MAKIFETKIWRCSSNNSFMEVFRSGGEQLDTTLGRPRIFLAE